MATCVKERTERFRAAHWCRPRARRGPGRRGAAASASDRKAGGPAADSARRRPGAGAGTPRAGSDRPGAGPGGSAST